MVFVRAVEADADRRIYVIHGNTHSTSEKPKHAAIILPKREETKQKKQFRPTNGVHDNEGIGSSENFKSHH